MVPSKVKKKIILLWLKDVTYLDHLRWWNTRYKTPQLIWQHWANLVLEKLWVWWKMSDKANICSSKQTHALLFATTFFNLQQMFLLHDKSILEGEKCETSTQNLQQNNVLWQVEGLFILFFAAFKKRRVFVFLWLTFCRIAVVAKLVLVAC